MFLTLSMIRFRILLLTRQQEKKGSLIISWTFRKMSEKRKASLLKKITVLGKSLVFTRISK